MPKGNVKRATSGGLELAIVFGEKRVEDRKRRDRHQIGRGHGETGRTAIRGRHQLGRKRPSIFGGDVVDRFPLECGQSESGNVAGGRDEVESAEMKRRSGHGLGARWTTGTVADTEEIGAGGNIQQTEEFRSLTGCTREAGFDLS